MYLVQLAHSASTFPDSHPRPLSLPSYESLYGSPGEATVDDGSRAVPTVVVPVREKGRNPSRLSPIPEESRSAASSRSNSLSSSAHSNRNKSLPPPPPDTYYNGENLSSDSVTSSTSSSSRSSPSILETVLSCFQTRPESWQILDHISYNDFPERTLTEMKCLNGDDKYLSMRIANPIWLYGRIIRDPASRPLTFVLFCPTSIDGLTPKITTLENSIPDDRLLNDNDIAQFKVRYELEVALMDQMCSDLNSFTKKLISAELGRAIYMLGKNVRSGRGNPEDLEMDYEANLDQLLEDIHKAANDVADMPMEHRATLFLYFSTAIDLDFHEMQKFFLILSPYMCENLGDGFKEIDLFINGVMFIVQKLKSNDRNVKAKCFPPPGPSYAKERKKLEKEKGETKKRKWKLPMKVLPKRRRINID